MKSPLLHPLRSGPSLEEVTFTMTPTTSTQAKGTSPKKCKASLVVETT